jgi:FAD/FMN-containing dehydrogenase
MVLRAERFAPHVRHLTAPRPSMAEPKGMIMTAEVPTHALAGLRDRFEGRLMLPGQDGYDDARHVWNARHNHRPALIVQPASAGDTAAAVTFARERGLGVCIRGGGHNHAGYAIADGALMLDLSAMASVRFDLIRRVATIGGGATWDAVNQATQVAGLAVTGADVSRVGVAGATLGGGLGWLHRMLGLSSDNLIAAEVVTADAEVLRVSADEHPDLWWALRGGGGNFGAVTAFTFALHPVGPAHVGIVICPMDRAADALALYQHLCESGGDELFIRAMLVTAPAAPFVPEQLRGRPAVTLSAAWFGPAGQAESALRELRRFTPLGADLVRPVPYAQLQRMSDAMVPRRVRAVARGGFTGPLSAGVVDVLSSAAAQPPPMSMVELQPLGGAVARISPDATAFPHRLATHALAILGAAPPGHPGDEQDEWAETVDGSLPAGTILGPSVLIMGRDEPEDRIREAYGQAPYDRLAEIKAAYDPDNMFRFNQNIRPRPPRPGTAG